MSPTIFLQIYLSGIIWNFDFRDHFIRYRTLYNLNHQLELQSIFIAYTNSLNSMQRQKITRQMVDNIMDKRSVQGKTQYLVKWKDCSQLTWVRDIHLYNVYELIKQYQNTYFANNEQNNLVFTSIKQRKQRLKEKSGMLIVLDDFQEEKHEKAIRLMETEVSSQYSPSKIQVQVKREENKNKQCYQNKSGISQILREEKQIAVKQCYKSKQEILRIYQTITCSRVKEIRQIQQVDKRLEYIVQYQESNTLILDYDGIKKYHPHQYEQYLRRRFERKFN